MLRRLTPLFWLAVLAALLSFRSGPSTVRPPKVEAYVTKFRYLAVEVNQKMGIPIPIVLAVAGLESNWGTSELALYGNNHFGLKKKENWKGQVYCKNTNEFDYSDRQWTVENDCFRKYTFIRDSYMDFGNFLRTQSAYAYLFRIPQENVEGWAHGLWYCNYATDPDYPFKLMDMIKKYNLK